MAALKFDRDFAPNPYALACVLWADAAPSGKRVRLLAYEEEAGRRDEHAAPDETSAHRGKHCAATTDPPT